MSQAYNLFFATLERKAPRLHSVLVSPTTGPTPDTYLHDIFAGLFTGHLSLDNATRLWDVMVFEGDAVAVRGAIAYVMALETKLLGAADAQEVCAIVKSGLGDMSEDDWMKNLRSAGKS
jgi:hypothetical protein